MIKEIAKIGLYPIAIVWQILKVLIYFLSVFMFSVTSDFVGTMFASSTINEDYSAFFASDLLANKYWCSAKKPPKPVCLWAQFKEPKRIVKIKFEEQYEMTGENGYEVNEIAQ